MNVSLRDSRMAGKGRLETNGLRSRESALRFRVTLDPPPTGVGHAAAAQSNRINAGDRPMSGPRAGLRERPQQTDTGRSAGAGERRSPATTGH